MIAKEQSFKPFVQVSTSIPNDPLHDKQKSASMPPKVNSHRSSLDLSLNGTLNTWQQEQHNQRQQYGDAKASQFQDNYYLAGLKNRSQCKNTNSDSGFLKMMQILSKRNTSSDVKNKSNNQNNNSKTEDISPWFSPSSSAIDSMSFMMKSIPVEDDKKREILKYQTIKQYQKQMISRGYSAGKEKKTDIRQLSLKRNPYPQTFFNANKNIKDSLKTHQVDQILRYHQMQKEPQEQRQLQITQYKSDSFRTETKYQTLNGEKKRSLSQFLGFERIKTRFSNQNDFGTNITITKQRATSQHNSVHRQKQTNSFDSKQQVQNYSVEHDGRNNNTVAQDTKAQIHKNNLPFQNQKQDQLFIFDLNDSQKYPSQKSTIKTNEERFFLRNLLSWRLQR